MIPLEDHGSSLLFMDRSGLPAAYVSKKAGCKNGKKSGAGLVHGSRVRGGRGGRGWLFGVVSSRRLPMILQACQARRRRIFQAATAGRLESLPASPCSSPCCRLELRQGPQEGLPLGGRHLQKESKSDQEAAIGRNCTGFCTAAFLIPRFCRRIRLLFDSPWGYSKSRDPRA
jgi:hypothetical protein